MMEVIPAIDIRAGRCVRLIQGDYSKETIFADNPMEMAIKWESEGAEYLHIIDLDGAKEGSAVNMDVISKICADSAARIQVGGGIRDYETAARYMDVGVSRVIMGTSAVDRTDELERILKSIGAESLVVSVDAREGIVALDGWTRESRMTVETVVKNIEALGVKRCMYTDILKDGTLSEPNYAGVENVVSSTNMKIMAAGGIAALSQLKRMSIVGVEATIVGRALYTGDIRLRQAIDELK
ncbi:MAG: 1-(5-phosphoribosyl)-5-[(5-phosphoribosylamino)methylideneamino]imidazole-4-carboxamide isomerase [Chloroflexota bacterium]|jgi:phosphoribosylformimino-5-aminoimidazole carboxamide ribotide isomerase|nr:MAG: 1-(5-phosphoribosyl)-5-[(5-phosphoribosylamino)methylideneamino]imidazole-4-carboxamide isomerase [SAR202 cluster bacterium]MEC7734145.1 1-(5-phosphoribosyl)-5-[(5-phosphoribosylamino)methylideneamino]imidazole-4-carboxamide isomerase [Chloroflexota bacterium]MEE3346281.1 1-(5-phosphoribosyl)-5-[(5-phosphoribosylamino)methylideneamino]imidazole-4-carboxamide isomerase [Chloroflexota bacterium]|tara:strand:- start:2933 stop:3652 length:720 start_codon:yes stop_codon:yes gene_type:complete